jgi:hypothetical protein
MLAVVWLLVGPPTPDRSNVIIQTKWDTLVLQVAGLAWVWQPHPIRIVEKLVTIAAGWKLIKRPSKIKDLRMGA